VVVAGPSFNPVVVVVGETKVVGEMKVVVEVTEVPEYGC